MAISVRDVIEKLRAIEAASIEGAGQSKQIAEGYAQIRQRAERLQAAHSQSWFGDHTLTYFNGFESPPPGASFDIEWGFVENILHEQNRGWRIYSRDAVNEHIYGENHREVSEKLKADEAAARERLAELIEATSDLVTLFKSTNEPYQRVKSELLNFKAADPTERLNAELGVAPRMTRDAGEAMKGRIAPQHVVALSYLHSIGRNSEVALRLAGQVRRCIGILEMTSGSARGSVAPSSIFLGHGRSSQWRELADFLSSRLHVSIEEFNSISTAGLTTTERLSDLLNRCNFAFLVFTAEDEHVDETLHARENVIHEAGLFQGRVSFRRAIVVLEEGCAEFGNITGLGQIRFPPNRISACFEEIRKVLEREELLLQS